jgi:hypothetical protein
MMSLLAVLTTVSVRLSPAVELEGTRPSHTDCPSLRDVLERIVERGICMWLFQSRAAMVWCWHVCVKRRGPNKRKQQG